MNKVVVALIINRNRYLITKITSGEFAGKGTFPSVNVETNETAFDAIKHAIKKQLSVDVFPYQNVKTLLYNNQIGKLQLALIKCSISDETKRTLSNDIPSKYKWIYVFNTTNIDFAPINKKILSYLTGGETVIRVKRNARGLASMSVEQRKRIASLGGQKAHALGRAHRFTREEARRAGTLGGRPLKGTTYKQPRI